MSFSTLDYLHANDIVHGDVNPGNLLIDARGHLRVTDFGISGTLRRVHPTGAERSTRRVTMVRGRHLVFSAPEVHYGNPVPASDQFSLALVFCAMLVGTRRFSAHRQTEFPELTAEQNLAIARALHQNYKRRFPSCGAFAAELG